MASSLRKCMIKIWRFRSHFLARSSVLAGLKSDLKRASLTASDEIEFLSRRSVYRILAKSAAPCLLYDASSVEPSPSSTTARIGESRNFQFHSRTEWSLRHASTVGDFVSTVVDTRLAEGFSIVHEAGGGLLLLAQVPCDGGEVTPKSSCRYGTSQRLLCNVQYSILPEGSDKVIVEVRSRPCFSTLIDC